MGRYASHLWHWRFLNLRQGSSPMVRPTTHTCKQILIKLPCSKWVTTGRHFSGWCFLLSL
jgi:hypothetical protein